MRIERETTSITGFSPRHHGKVICMIKTLEQLVEYINSDKYNQITVNRIIEENGWMDTSSRSDYDVCQSGDRKVVLDENTGEAKIVSIDTMYLLGKAVAIIEDICGYEKGFPKLFSSICAPPAKSQSLLYWSREALKNGCEDLSFMDVLDYRNMTMNDPFGRYWVGYYRTKNELCREKERLRIGTVVRELREKKGYSLRKLSELSGVSVQNLTKIEHGRYNVSIDILGRISTALGAQITIE